MQVTYRFFFTYPFVIHYSLSSDFIIINIVILQPLSYSFLLVAGLLAAQFL